MATQTTNLKLPRPVGTDTFNLASHQALVDALDTNAAKSVDLGNINDLSLDASLKGKSLTEMAKVLFQSASDGKGQIATAITQKGGSASPSDTFSTLATAIGRISTGKKFAKGSTSSSAATAIAKYYNSTGGLGCVKLSVSNLDFKPSVIVALRIQSTSISLVVYTIDSSTLKESIKMASFYDGFSSSSGTHHFTTNVDFYVNLGEFILPSSSGTYDWIAYE